MRESARETREIIERGDERLHKAIAEGNARLEKSIQEKRDHMKLMQQQHYDTMQKFYEQSERHHQDNMAAQQRFDEAQTRWEVLWQKLISPKDN